MPSIKDDEELARALQEEYEREAARTRNRQQQHQPPPPMAPHEENRPARPIVRSVRPSSTRPNVESDEQLARRLEQEMKDEEMARRLSTSNGNLNAPSSSRPRPSPSTLLSSNSRQNVYSAGTPVSTSDAVASPVRSSRRSSSHRHSSSRRHSSTNNGRRSSNRDRRSSSSGRRGSSQGGSRDRHGSSSSSRRRSSDRRSGSSGRPHRPSSSRRRASDGTRSSSGINPSPRQSSSQRNHRPSSRSSAHSSGQPHSHSRGRGSAVSPAVEPDYALPATSVDPPIVSATIVDTPTSVSPPQQQQQQQPIMMDSYVVSSSAPEPDVELAMRLAQEERDAALAEELERADQEIASRNATRLARATSGPRRRPWTCRRVAGLVIPLVLIAGASVVIMLLVAGRGDLSGVPNIFDDDPFAGNPDDASRWKNTGEGLQLEVVNALQEQWHNNFNIAMDEWDAGTPDALTLSRSTAEYDFDCSPIRGKMKVCNGNYGDTRWKGINQVLLSGGWIISSTAKLNEYYLAGASEAQRQYTTCHEIGHGFGLPHTDENFYNADLGNCMDYTNNPEVNKSPDESNYEFLEDLYGTVPQRRDLGFIQPDGDFDEEFLERYMNAVHKMEFEDTQHGVMWNLLHRNKHFEHFSSDLGNNFTVQVHVLRAD